MTASGRPRSFSHTPSARQSASVAFQVALSPTERLLQPGREPIRESHDSPPPRFQHQTGPAFRLGVVVDLNDVDPAPVRDERHRQIGQTACVDSAQRALTRGVAAAGSPARHSLDVALYGMRHRTSTPESLSPSRASLAQM